MFAAAIWLGAGQLQAQTSPRQPSTASINAAPAQPEPIPEAAAAMLPDDELDALVARIALYPDPLLAVVLQASTLPLELVEADRFLEKRTKNPQAQPKKDWDASIIALLNYPSVVAMMSDDLEWTQALGGAVLNQLGDVQDSIQQFRAEVQAAGLLKSDDKQTITDDGDIIKIEPAQPQVIYVPMYDGAALAAAIASQPAASGGSEIAPAAPTEQAAVPSAAPAPAAPAPAAPVSAEGTTVVYPPAYPSAYPPPTYSQPYPSFWTPAASFVGGAVVGGLLGYAFSDDHDDIEVYHHGDGYGGGRNVSGNRTVTGNTVNVVTPSANRRETNTQTQAALRARSGRQIEANSARAQQARAQVNRGAAAPAASASAAAARSTGAAATNRPPAQRTSERSGTRKPGAEPSPRADSSAFSDVKSGRDTRRESARGAESRAASQRQVASAAPQQRQASTQRMQQRPQRETAGASRDRPSQASGGAFASRDSGSRATMDANRGARSRGGRR